MLGVGTMFLAELRHTDPHERPLIMTTGLIVCTSTITVFALGTLVLAPVLGQSLRTIAQHWDTALLFVIGAAATGVGGTLDFACIGMRRSPVALARNAMSSIA